LVIRFVGLERAPHGFWLDETWDAVQVMCLAENGHDADGKFWPLISNGQGGGSLPITWTAQMVAWTRVFGTSIAGFRSLAALWVVFTCLGLFAIARGLTRLAHEPLQAPTEDSSARWFPWLACVAGLVSPWSFQFSRMSWEQPLAPCFLVLSVLALVRSRLRGNVLWAVLCGVSGACSMITYPPLRIAVPCVLACGGTALLMCNAGASRRKFAVMLGIAATTLCATFAPIVIRLASGQDTKRMMYVSIFSPEWINAHRGGLSSARFFLLTFFDNLWLHLRPSYLFGTGDPNLRHSAQIIGELSPVDVLAVALAAAAVAWAAVLSFRQMKPQGAPHWPRLDAGEQMLVAVAFVSVAACACATFPAALTWEGLPHALRSIGVWPFVALFSGAVLSIAWQRLRWVPALTAMLTVAYTGYFMPEYFRVYKNVDPSIFHRDISEALAAVMQTPQQRPAEDHSMASPPAVRVLRPFAKRYGQEVLRYYLMHDARLKCNESLAVYEQLRRAPRRKNQ
jgi:hypothetical protein